MCRNKQFFEVSSKMRNTIRLGVTGWLRGTQANAGSQISGPVGEKIRLCYFSCCDKTALTFHLNAMERKV